MYDNLKTSSCLSRGLVVFTFASSDSVIINKTNLGS